MRVYSVVRSEHFTAIVDMEQILVAESAVASDLRDYIVREEERLAQLKR